MELILLERVEKLGQLGDIVRVKDGYARNHLLPQRKAVRATKAAKELFETDRANIEAQNASRRESASQEASRMAGVQVVIVQQAGDTGQLYGAVRSRDVAIALTEAGYAISRKQVVLKTVIKSLGIYSADVWLHAEECVEVSVNVARSEEEAKLQASGVEVGVSADQEVSSEVDLPEVEALFEQPPEDPDLTVDDRSGETSPDAGQLEE